MDSYFEKRIPPTENNPSQTVTHIYASRRNFAKIMQIESRDIKPV